jgi:hypothetical protein
MHAPAASRQEEQHDPVAHGKIGIFAGADFQDRCRRFVPQRHRHRTRPVAVDH